MLTKPIIEKYFFAEKQESLIFLFIGITAIIIAIVFFFYFKSAVFKGLSIPLITIGLLQIVVGYTVYARSDRQRIDVVYAYDMNPRKLEQDELPRMQTVMKNFVVYRYVEIVLAFAGVFLFLFFRTNTERLFWCGFGLTLVIQSLVMLVADYYAEARGQHYLDAVKTFCNIGNS